MSGTSPPKSRSSPTTIGYWTATSSRHRYQRQNRPLLVFIFWSWNKQLYVPNTSHLTAYIILRTAMVFQEGDLTRLSSPLLGGSGSAPLLPPQHPALLHCLPALPALSPLPARSRLLHQVRPQPVPPQQSERSVPQRSGSRRRRRCSELGGELYEMAEGAREPEGLSRSAWDAQRLRESVEDGGAAK